jgi:hypothetical protein
MLNCVKYRLDSKLIFRRLSLTINHAYWTSLNTNHANLPIESGLSPYAIFRMFLFFNGKQLVALCCHTLCCRMLQEKNCKKSVAAGEQGILLLPLLFA